VPTLPDDQFQLLVHQAGVDIGLQPGDGGLLRDLEGFKLLGGGV
jgi:hypothetical protein